MILVALLLIPLIGGLLAWLTERRSARLTRWIALGTLGLNLALTLVLWAQSPALVGLGTRGAWLVELDLPWIVPLGIGFHLALDGLSLLLALLTNFLGIMAVLASWHEIKERVGFFHFCLLAVLTGILGVFMALDLFLFYFLWELMLVPMYFLISIWGHEQRVYAAVKFFLFTQASGLLMLIAILALYLIHGQATGTYTFDYHQLLGTTLDPAMAFWLMLGFFVAFAVKLPAVPVHSWLPDAHTEAPTAGSVILAGLMLKTGAYGLLRFVVPLFPQAATAFAPVALGLGVVGVLYGAWTAFGQHDFKRLVAYTSVSHMGFVLLGIFSLNELALQGAVLEIIAHGISTGALFILAGALQDRIGTRDMDHMGGLWAAIPKMAGVTLVFALASLGLPGLGNFLAEFLVLVGSYRVSPLAASLAAVGLVLAAIYALWFIQRIFHGPNREGWAPPDLSARELAMMAAMITVIVWLGLYPQPVLDTAKPALDTLTQQVATLPHAAEAAARTLFDGGNP